MHVCIISLRIQPAVATAYSDEKFGSRITIHDQEYRFQTSFSSLDCLCYFFFFLLVPNCLLEFCWPFFRVSRVLQCFSQKMECLHPNSLITYLNSTSSNALPGQPALVQVRTVPIVFIQKTHKSPAQKVFHLLFIDAYKFRWFY